MTTTHNLVLLRERVDKCVSMANSKSRLFDEYIMVWKVKKYKF